MGEPLPTVPNKIGETEPEWGMSLRDHITFCEAEIFMMERALLTSQYSSVLTAEIIQQSVDITKDELAELQALNPLTTSWIMLQEIVLRYQHQMNALFPAEAA